MNGSLKMYLAWGGAVAMGGLLGGLNFMWAHIGGIPAYGYVVDAALLALMVVLVLYVRRERMARSDEFAVVKKRTAATTAMMFGFVVYGLIMIARGVFAGPYKALLDQLQDKDDAFTLGMTLGMVPFALGMLFGLVFVWRKYG